MIRKILLLLIEWLYKLTYQKLTLDKINSKIIRPVPGLIINGKQYWEFANVADIPEGRRTHYSSLREEMNMGIDRAQLLEYIEQLKLANDKTESSRIGSLLYMLEDTIKNITTIEAIYNIASLAYFDGQEDLTTYDIDYAQQKIALFKQLPDKGFFFDRLLRETLKFSGEQWQQDTAAFLVEGAAKLRAYNRIVHGGTHE